MADRKNKRRSYDDDSEPSMVPEPLKEDTEVPSVPEAPQAEATVTEDVSSSEDAPPAEKTLDSTTPEETKATGTVLEGMADQWHCLAKAYNEKEGWMKSTKALRVGGGCLIQVTTQQKNPDGTWAIAEAVCFAERANLIVEDGKARFM